MVATFSVVDHLGRELDRLGELRIAGGHLDLEERNVGSGLLLDVQRPDQLEDEPSRIVDLLQEVDVRRHRSVEADLKREAVAFARREFVGDVAIGDEDVVGHEPTGADPVEPRAL